MSNDAITSFLERAGKDRGLAQRLREIGDRGDPAAAGAAIVALAAEAGFHFTVAELDREIGRRTQGRLSEEQLEKIAGGYLLLPEIEDEVIVTLLKARRLGGDGGTQEAT